MLIYSVTIFIDKAIETDWLSWMQAVHVPDVLKTNLFLSATLQKHIDIPESEPQARYTIRYEMASKADYDRYQAECAPALQKDHTERYAGRFSGSRVIMEVVE